MTDKKSLKGFFKFLKNESNKSKNTQNLTWVDLLFILLLMGLMFVSGAWLSAKWCDAQVEDRINIILNDIYAKSSCAASSINDYMFNYNITNISEWSEKRYDEIKSGVGE